MPRGLKKLTHVASTQAAWRDWHTLETWARENGHGEAVRFHAPNEGAGWKTVDKQIEKLRVALGAPERPWGSSVLEGLQAQQIQTPADPEPREQQQPQPDHEPPLPPEPPEGDRRQGQRGLGRRKEWNVEAIEAALLTRTPEGRGNYTDTVSYKFAHGDLTREGAARAMGAPLAVVPIFWGPEDHERLASQQSTAQPQQIQPPPADPEQREQQQPDPQLPPAEPRPSLPAEGQTYTERVWTAYRALCDEMQTSDIPIHAIHRRVGGSIADLHAFLRAECLAHRATPSTGEPAFAGDAAKQSALHLPGEKESFLLVKLLEPPATIQSAEIAAGVGIFDVAVPTMADSQKPRITISLTAEQARLLADAIQHVSQQAEFQDLHRELQAFADRPHEYVQEHKPNELERYEQLLRATAKLRYPEHTPELEARIEKTVQKRLGEFRQEQQLRAYEARLRRTVAEKHPPLTAKEAEHYERRMKELLASRREELARKQQPQQPARQQGQGRAIGR